jgi:hypothetical protein
MAVETGDAALPKSESAPRFKPYDVVGSGAFCPERSVSAAIILPEVNVAAMNGHLAEINRPGPEQAARSP